MVSFATGLGLALQGVGIVSGIIGSAKQSSAIEDQADSIENLSAEEQAFIIEQSEIEAQLIEAQGFDEAEVLIFNEGVALSNAEWERRAGAIALQQSQKQWRAQVGTVVSAFAASGARLTATTNDVIMEQISEMELDLFNLGLNTERAAAREEDQARLFSLQRDQVGAATKRKSSARKRIGLLESETAGTAASARAGAARTGARTAQISGFGSAVRGAASLFGDIAEL